MYIDHEAPRSDRSPKRPDESMWAFLDRMAGSYWDRVRSLLESWLAGYPANERQRLVLDLMGSNTKFSSGFWELYLHQLVLAHGGEAECHPEVKGSARRPDFLVKGVGVELFFLEAVVLGRTS